MPAISSINVAPAVEAAVRELVSARHWGDCSFVNLPIIYPGGTLITVKVEWSAIGFKVSDSGFAYRELESLGMQRSFGKTASNVAETSCLVADRRSVSTEVPPEQLVRAICDVGIASWQIVDRVVSRLSQQEEIELEEHLRDRLTHLFGEGKLRPEHKIIGASTSEWDVTAVVDMPDRPAVFHAVSNHANSVFKASTAFGDLADLKRPPMLIAVVRDKAAFGSRLALLSRNGRVIEEDQPNDVYLKAAA